MRTLLIATAALLPLTVAAQLGKVESLPHKGDILFQQQFEDKGGSNVIFASHVSHEKEMRSDVYVYQYVSNGGAPVLVWDIQDFGTALCDMVVQEESLQVLDLDGDGYKESTCIYQQRCDGLDPYVTKLMLHSRGKKYAIRGLLAVEDGTQLEKTPDEALESAAPQLRNFAHSEWDEFVKEGATTTSKHVYATGTGWTVLAKEDLMAGGSISFELLDANGKSGKLSTEAAKGIEGAKDINAMSNPSKLIFASLEAGVGIYEPATGKLSTLMTFLGDTEGLSLLSWSQDKKKVAFVALNSKQYPNMTRIFVLTLDGSTLVRKDKHDAPVFCFAAADWAINHVEFLDNKTIQFNTRTREGEEGPVERIVLE